MTRKFVFISIKENHWIAWLAAKKLKSRHGTAIVLGHTIYLHNTTETDFISNSSWLRHELTHIHQFQQYGFWRFIFLYLIESYRKGYYQNRFEVEARFMEKENFQMNGYYYIVMS